MALRDKLATRVAPLLEPGEQPVHTFPAQGGPHPTVVALCLGAIGYMILAKPRIVSVTDRSIVVLEANKNGTKPTRVLNRIPRNTTIGPVKGMWSPVQLAGEKVYVHRKYHQDVKAADGMLTS